MHAIDLEVSSVLAQWVGAVAAVGAVVVAIVFGYLTLATTRRSKDAQERSAITAVTDSNEQGIDSLMFNANRQSWPIQRTNAGTFTLMNNSTLPFYDVRIEGLTDLDKRRLTVNSPQPLMLEAGARLEFSLVSRLTLSGPANLVLTYAIDPGGTQRIRKVLLVPAT
ncbi:hypothetical protein [Cryobacterium sp. PH31-L1]|uniref:hypothetical protein n=1 Tax=Cryobacterium sp. PH31-L1 TaxID=3046199 RepID=UPI0024BA6804|nr:hypothetical protein [Cryobacterium sp. PH31-L1]MDJ0376973.1 hypothetical protein [Cryobacterium sp. PH31-L1]